MQVPTPKLYAQRLTVPAVAAVILAIPVVVMAQGAGKKPTPAPASKPAAYAKDTVHLSAKLGSFKLMRKGPKSPPRGSMTITFKGSLLISGLEGNGTLVTSGNLRREYYDAKHNKQVWFGQGKAVISGTMHNVEWFGEDMQATFKGDGVFRLYGEFGDDKKTGEFWFDANNRYPWLPSGSNVPVPEQRLTIPGTGAPLPTGPQKVGT
jgi:hypothetical protein